MNNVLEFQIVEVEIGPHFLTFYGGPRKELLQFARQLRPEFDKVRPDLKKIQQKDFAHEKSDPRVYHPYGHPIMYPRKGRCFHEESNHFHIRYGYRPDAEDLNEVMALIIKHGGSQVFKEDLKISNLEDNKAMDWDYPPAPKNQDEYLEYINDIRANKYNSVVE